MLQDDDVISTDVTKKGELTHYRWCTSLQPSSHVMQASIFMLPLNAFGGYYDQATLL